MKKIELNIPEKGNKNSIFKELVNTLKGALMNDDSLDGKLAPLGNIKFISAYNLRLEMQEKFGINITEGEFNIKKKNYEKANKCKIEPIRGYNNISKSEVYLLDDIKGFRDYLINEK